MRGYKAFNKDLTCRGMQYEIGKEYKFDSEPVPCRQGYHFCETISDCYEFYPMEDDTRICEVEALGEITQEGVKFVTNYIKVLDEVTGENLKKGNTGSSNSGYRNSGYRNSGDRNSGDRNSGYRNSGYRNSGDWNSGDRNSGDWNSGGCNSGDWNSGDRNSGVFCTEKQPTIKIFDVQTDWTFDDWEDSEAYRVMSKCPYSYSDYISADDMTDEEKERHPEYKTIGGYIKVFSVTNTDKQSWWDSLSNRERQAVYDLPNFDADKFFSCTGIKAEVTK